jgi:hypothetical protein
VRVVAELLLEQAGVRRCRLTLTERRKRGSGDACNEEGRQAAEP